jgi:hypothetical protein
LYSLSAACLALAALAGGPASAKSDCRKSALEALRSGAPDGYAVYQQIKDKSFFGHWLNCDDAQFELPTAVHESVHYVTGDIDAFPLTDGGEIARPHEVSEFYPPSRLAKAFKRDDFVDTYLKPGRASSSSDFLYLLDELNAYTHDLNAAVDLKKLRSPERYVDNRDGLAALMAFVALYVERAEKSEPATWSGLQKPEVAKTVATLWDHAEKVMQSSCGLARFGTQDKAYIRRFCAAGPEASLQSVIGRAPVCPTECLKSASEEDAAFQAVEEEDAAPPDPKTRTIWSRRTNRRAAPGDDAASEDDATNQ